MLALPYIFMSEFFIALLNATQVFIISNSISSVVLGLIIVVFLYSCIMRLIK